MKKRISVLVAVVLAVGLAACGQAPERQGSPGDAPGAQSISQLQALARHPACRVLTTCPV
jgi:hypothetical protein